MARLGLAILVGLLLVASTPGISNGEDPEPAWMKQALELSQRFKQHQKKENELCARRNQIIGGGELHCMTHLADRDLRAGYDVPQDVLRSWTKKRLEQVRAILASGADANTRDLSGNTPLHIVSGSSGDPELMSILLKAGANPNVANKTGITPLIAASWRGHWPAVEMLIKHGAHKTINAKGKVHDAEGTALHWAAFQGYAEIVTALLRAGADPFAKAEGALTAVELAEMGRKKTRGSVVPFYATIKALRRAQSMVAEQTRGRVQKKPAPRPKRYKYRQAY